MECKYCKNSFKTISSLNNHIKHARYCLKLREEEVMFICEFCEKSFSSKYGMVKHQVNCRDLYENIKKNIKKNMKEKYEKLLFDQKKEYEKRICDLQDKLENIAIKAVQNPTTMHNTTTKNIQINNFLKNAPALTDAVIQDNIQYLTLDHHVQGAEGYAKYAMEFPFKGRIVCVDVARNKIKYKDGDGNVIEDVGFQKMMMKLCKAIFGKSYDLSIEHLDKLAKKFTEKELEQYDYLAAAKAITMYSKGSESDFCRKIVKIISKSAVSS
jgi:uncharacterized C2H2 Zn-finger protein